MLPGYEVCFMAQTSPKGALCVCPNRKINVAGALTDIQHETKINIPPQARPSQYNKHNPLLFPSSARLPSLWLWLYDH